MPISGTPSFAKLLWPELKKLYVDREADEVLNLAFVRKPKKAPEWALIGNATCIRETARALLVRVPRSMAPLVIPSTIEIWVPKSQLHKTENEINKLGDAGFLVIPEWLAKEKGLL